MRLLGQEKGPISIKKLIEARYSNKDSSGELTFEEAFKILVEEEKALTLNEIKILF